MLWCFITPPFHTQKYPYGSDLYVGFKSKHLVFNCYKTGWRGRIHFLPFVIWMKLLSLVPNSAWKLAHKWSINLWSKIKEEHNFSYHVPKRPKFLKRKMTFEIPKFKLLNRLEQVLRQTGLWEPKPPKNLQVLFADSEFRKWCRDFNIWVGRWSKWNGGVTVFHTFFRLMWW